MWQLDASGTFAPLDKDDGLDEIDGAVPPDVAPDARAVVIRFSGYADGRGFSTARHLRSLGYTGTLIAAGPLAPDQARHAMQSGFDAVRVADEAVARHSESAWRNALTRSTRALYVADPTSRGGENSIWHARHTAAHQ